MGQYEIYENLNKKEIELFELWLIRKSPIAKFIEDLQHELGLLINCRTGTIIKIEDDRNYFEETKLRVVLNHEMFIIDAIYYDDRQFLIRVADDQRIRKVMLRTIQEIHHEGQIFEVKNRYSTV